jgi:hydrogenase nickel incorporation protein HypB
VNPALTVLQVSATSGAGMETWLDWLLNGLDVAKAGREKNVELLKQRIAELEAQLQAAATPT